MLVFLCCNYIAFVLYFYFLIKYTIFIQNIQYIKHSTYQFIIILVKNITITKKNIYIHIFNALLSDYIILDKLKWCL